MKRLGAEVLKCVSAVVLVCVSAAVAQGQPAPDLRAHRLLLDGGVVWSGSYAIGDSTAQLRGNAAGPSPPPFTLFSSSSEVGSVTSVVARVGFTLTPRLVLEGGAAFGTPRVPVAMSRDPEASPQQLAGEQLKQYLFDAAVVWHLPMRWGVRVRPFVIGGVGYLRQLHEERTLAETGQVYYGGLGVRHWRRGGSGVARAFGLRGDVRANVRLGGIDFDDKNRVFPTLSVHLFVSL